MEDQQPTQQATQLIVDPRRLGHSNSGMSDEDLVDIFCILTPASTPAHKATSLIAKATPQHTIAPQRDSRIRQKIEGPQPEGEAGDSSDLASQGIVSCDLALRLSADLKDPDGFRFGRNTARCDIVLGQEDEVKRISNIHFRIYINDYGVIMLEDQSTNGTVIDGNLLRAKEKENGKSYTHTLEVGSVILLTMTPPEEDFRFIVRIPARDSIAEGIFQANLAKYLHRMKQARANKIEARMKGIPREPPNIFAARDAATPSDSTSSVGRYFKEWRGGTKYNRVGTIGKGAFAVVYKITTKFDGVPYAAKELEKRRFMKNGILDQKMDMEMNIMRKIKHPNIVQFIEHIDWEEYLYIIMEYIPGGDLGTLINRYGRLKENEVQQMAIQLLDALKYLHDMGVTHRDVKPDNILIHRRNPLDVKLTDFGLSKMVDSEDTFLRTFCGTLLYCAPEVYSEYREYDSSGRRNRGVDRKQLPPQRYGHAVDVWSLAGVLFYSLCGAPPYPATNRTTYQELLNHIMTTPLDVRPLQLANVSEKAIRFVKTMLHIHPEYRATIYELAADSWLTGESSLEMSLDEIEEVDLIGSYVDPQLEEGASQLSMNEPDEREIRDSAGNLSDLTEEREILNSFGDDENSMSNGNESYGFMVHAPKNGGNGRLFGEVNASALGSSGAIPIEQLPSTRVNFNFPSHSFSRPSLYTSEEMPAAGSLKKSHDEPTVNYNFQSHSFSRESLSTSSKIAAEEAIEDARTEYPAVAMSIEDQMPPPPHNTDTTSPSNRNAKDRITRSSSLMGAESMVGHLNMHSPSPVASTTADMFSEGGTTVLNTGVSLRRRREEEGDGDQSWRPADMPIKKKIKSKRHIDLPVPPSIFWDPQDRSTHHKDYPNMSMSQFKEYEDYAAAKGEQFVHGADTFDTTMRSFRTSRSPSSEPEAMARAQSEPTKDEGRRIMMKRDDRSIGEARPKATEPRTFHSKDSPMPSTARGSREPDAYDFENSDASNIPSSAAQPVVGNDFQRPKRILGKIIGTPSSCLPTVTLNVTEPITSWGRGFKNTIRYSNGQDVRVPKYAFKIFLFKPKYYTAKGDLPTNSTPGNGKNANDQDMAFYISNKASSGIYINGVNLPSHDRQNPYTPSKFWGELRHGDIITVWRHDRDISQFTEFKFECYWGTSKAAREEGQKFEILPAGILLNEIEYVCLAQEKLMLAEIERRDAEEKLTLEEAQVRRTTINLTSKSTTNLT